MPKTILRNVASLLSANMVNTLLYLFLVMAISRQFGVIGVGQYSFALAFAGFIFLVFGFGLEDLLIRELSRMQEKILGHIGSVLVLSLFSGLAGYLVMALLAVGFGIESEVMPLVLVAGLMFLGMSLVNTILIGFWSKEDLHYNASTSVIRDFLGVFLAIALIAAGFQLVWVFWAILLGIIVSVLFSGAMFIRKIGFPTFSIDIPLWKSLIINALPFLLNSVLLLAIFEVDMVMVGLMTSSYETGLFGTAFTVLRALVAVFATVAMVFFPRLSVLWAEDQHRFRDLFIKAFSLFTLAGIAVVISLWFLAPVLLTLVFGSEFVAAVTLLRALLVPAFFLFVFMLIFVVLNAADRPWHNVAVFLVGLILNIFLNIFFISDSGGLGAAYASMIAYGMMFLLFLVYLFRLFRNH